MTGTTYRNETDRELVERFKAGDESAFEEMASLYGARLYGTAYSLLGNHHDAEEVVQDALVRAHRALDSFRGEAKLETWLYRIVMNLARNKFHWNRRRGAGVNFSLSRSPAAGSDVPEEDMNIPDEKNSPEKALANRELEKDILAAFDLLPDSVRQTMVLRHLEEMSYEDIASATDTQIGTVKSRLSRGREMLREIMKKMEKDDQRES